MPKASMKFLKSGVDPSSWPMDDQPEVAIVGRSNAGKSSVINGLAGGRLAKVSSTPGKTRLLNFFAVGNKYRLVDMPGYGFAARSGDEQAQWQEMIESYLLSRPNLVGLLLVMDSRRAWSEDEDTILRWLSPRMIPSFLILTKLDKLKRNELAKVQRQAEVDSGLPVFATSALHKTGFDELEDAVFMNWIQNKEGQ